MVLAIDNPCENWENSHWNNFIEGLIFFLNHDQERLVIEVFKGGWGTPVLYEGIENNDAIIR